MKRKEKLSEDEIFDAWNVVKKRLNKRRIRRFFKEGDVWWCGVGRNIGTEVYGKDRDFARPMLVYKKLDGRSFLGVCLTSKSHQGDWYVEVELKGRVEYVNLAQVRTTSINRLYNKMGRINIKDMKAVDRGFRHLYVGRRRQRARLKSRLKNTLRRWRLRRKQ